MGAEHQRTGLQAQRARPMDLLVRVGARVHARRTGSGGQRCGTPLDRRTGRTILDHSPTVPGSGPGPRCWRDALCRCRARQGNGHALRTRRRNRAAWTARPRAVVAVGCSSVTHCVRQAAAPRGSGISLLHHSRRNHRGPALGGCERSGMTDNQLSQAATALFDEFCSWETVGRAESAGWAGELWQILQQTGFTDVPVPDSLGGSDGSVADAAQLLRTAGAHGAPVPLAEAGLIGGWLLTAAGLSLPDGVRTVLPPSAGSLRLEGDRLFGTVSAVAWGHRAHYVVGLVDGVVIVALGPAATNQRPTVSRAVNLADEARDTLTFDGVPVTALAAAPEGVTEDSLADRAALARAALMAGGLSAVADLRLAVRPSRRGACGGRARRALSGDPIRYGGVSVNRLQRPGGVEVAYRVHNPHAPGVPLLLSHGFAATAGMWEPNIGALSADRPVIVWDQRGHGSSGAPESRDE